MNIHQLHGVFSHLEYPQLQAEVILASQGPNQKPIYTIRMRYPRIIHGEVLTHRLFSRNARSSRAVPVKTMLNEVRTMPFIPWHWGKNQKGMQASEECDELVAGIDGGGVAVKMPREELWLNARDAAMDSAEAYMDAGYHKQIPNRLLEPFSWIDTLITTTDLDNFLWLRDHKDAEPHLQDLARLVKAAVEDAEIHELAEGDWHQPYIDDEAACYAADKFGNDVEGGWAWLNKVSAARCAWISYRPFGGSENTDYAREMKTYEMLISSDRVHASPFEHQAKPDVEVLSSTSTLIEGKVVGGSERYWRKPELHGNLDGYIQARKLIPNECHHS